MLLMDPRCRVDFSIIIEREYAWPMVFAVIGWFVNEDFKLPHHRVAVGGAVDSASQVQNWLA